VVISLKRALTVGVSSRPFFLKNYNSKAYNYTVAYQQLIVPPKRKLVSYLNHVATIAIEECMRIIASSFECVS